MSGYVDLYQDLYEGHRDPTPIVTVEIGFATQPFASSTTWTDVTSYVDVSSGPVTIERGRGDAQSVADPGTCTFVLNNDDKRFTPGYTGGTYGANVIVGKRVRVTITHNSTNYRRFSGYITSYDLGWPTGVTQQSRVTVTAVDILGSLSQVKLRNVVEHTYLYSDPVALWPLDDSDESNEAQEVTGYRQSHLRPVRNRGGATLFFGGSVSRFSDGDAILGHAQGLPAIPHADSRSLRIKSPRKFESIFGWTAMGDDVNLQSATTSVAMGYWINYDAEAEDDRVYHSSLELTAGDPGEGGPCLTTGVSSKGSAFAAVTLDDGSRECLAAGRRIVDGGWHFVVAHYTETGNGVVKLYVDGVLIATSSAYGANFPEIPSTPHITIGGARRNDLTREQDNPTNARFAYLGVWTDTTADNLDVATLYEAGSTAWDGQDRTSARVTRVLNWLGVPSGRQDVERGLSEVQIGDMKKLTALEYINECVTAEQGFFFQKGNGDATFHARDHRWEGTSECTLSWHQPDERFVTDVEQTINTVMVSYKGGEVRAQDRTSRLAYGPRELSVDTQLSDRNQARGIADYVLKLREAMRPRMDTFTYDLLTEDTESIRDNVLRLELDDMFTVGSLPTQAHASSLSFWVEGVSESIGLDDWQVTFTTSPHKTAFEDFWVLGTSSDLDTDTSLGY